MASRRQIDGLVIGLGLALIVGGCGGKAGHAGAGYVDTIPLPRDTLTVDMPDIGAYGGRFRIVTSQSPKTFNGIMATENSSLDILEGRLFAGLTEYDRATQTNYPRLAKSWEVSPDGLTWIFHLRRGAAFSDGHPITSEDVLFSFQVAMDDSIHPPVLEFLQLDGKKFEVSAPDSYTVIIKTPRPYALMVPVAGSVTLMPKHVLEPAYRRGQFEAAYNVSTNPDSLVCSGPWRLKQCAPGEKVVLTRNPYWLGVDREGHRLPYLDELVYVIAPDQEAAALKFLNGEADAIDNVKPENYKTYAENQKKGDYTLYDLGPALTTNCFWFNLNKVRKPTAGKKIGDPVVDPIQYAWFSNPVFRRACSMAIDREAIIQSVFYGDAVKNWSTSTPGNKVWYDPDIKHYDYDPGEAKRLLAGLGWRDRNGDGILEDSKGHTVRFTIKTNAEATPRVAMCNFVRDDLAKIGIQCTPKPVEFNTLTTNIHRDFQYEAIMLGFGGAVPPDPGMGQNVWRSSGFSHQWNVEQPHPETPEEAEIDRLMTENVTTQDLAARKRTWTAIRNIVNEQCWLVWLPTVKAKVPISNRFGNLRPTVIYHRILWNIDQVFLKSLRPRA
ncbi:MAG TPA: ABC transporter substrate-binding protein [Candidatus Eisenbacteria bacterium]